MPSFVKTISIISFFVASVQAHMRLYYPYPFQAEENPYRTGPADEYLTYPYNCCGKKTPFPCRGYLNQVGTPQGRPVATWAAGSTANFSLTGTGNHYGGSCQVGFSIDNGTTWKVVRSYEGNCPHRDGGTDPAKQTFEFTVPADMPAGDHIFAWTWFNREQEFYMVCSPVTITSSSNSTVSPAGASPASSSASAPPGSSAPPHVAFADRPSFLFADLDNGCRTPNGNAEVKFPNPGPDVVQGDGAYPLALPTGEKCGN
ncbi:endoglucanase [Thermoascus aurantiacus ATCC 26904]